MIFQDDLSTWIGLDCPTLPDSDCPAGHWSHQYNAEREAREAREAEREARQEEAAAVRRKEVLQSYIDTPITDGLSSAGSLEQAYALFWDSPILDTAHMVRGVTAAQLLAARDSGDYAITCPRGEWANGKIVLHDCDLD